MPGVTRHHAGVFTVGARQLQNCRETIFCNQRMLSVGKDTSSFLFGEVACNSGSVRLRAPQTEKSDFDLRWPEALRTRPRGGTRWSSVQSMPDCRRVGLNFIRSVRQSTNAEVHLAKIYTIVCNNQRTEIRMKNIRRICSSQSSWLRRPSTDSRESSLPATEVKGWCGVGPGSEGGLLQAAGLLQASERVCINVGSKGHP